jgi:hypothetical protein
MSEKLNIEEMCHAYRLLYETETQLRIIIDIRLKKEYGPFWFHRKTILSIDFHTAYYFELIRIIQKFPSLKSLFSQTQIQELTNLTEVRNKICHMKNLTPTIKKNFLDFCHHLDGNSLIF